jgi:16S rRNA (adenine1518-N6/adenine1519-N6)-dimethyltransferase
LQKAHTLRQRIQYASEHSCFIRVAASASTDARHHSNAKSTTLDAAQPRNDSQTRRLNLPSKSKLGQNFLRDPAAIERIVAALGPLAHHTVVEIGPGRGAITESLARRAERLLAIEVDPVLAAALRDRFAAKHPHVEIVAQDVLTFDFVAAARRVGQSLLVVGNLPYYITSPILMHLAASTLTQGTAVLDSAVLMVQSEVADRVTAAPGTRDYGLLSVLCALHGTATPLFTLPPEAFFPAPKVHSTVFRWNFAPRFAALSLEPLGFTALLRAAFAQKRKTLSNNLRAAGYSPGRVIHALAAASVPPQARAEQLSLDHFAALHHAIVKARDVQA